MKKLGKKVIEELERHPEGIMGVDIARNIGENKTEVNRFLAFEQDEYVKTENYLWVRKNPQTGIARKSTNKSCSNFGVLKKLNNREGARKYTIKQFNALADWSRGVTHKPDEEPMGMYETRTGNIIDYDSAPELAMLTYLEDNELVAAIGGQNLCLSYSTAFTNEKYYYPDIVALTNDGYIIVIEVKAITAMSYNIERAKYDALAEYCEDNGFMYMMIAPDYDYMTFEELYDMQVDGALVDIFDKLELKRQNAKKPIRFDDEDVNEWYDEIGDGYTKTEFRVMVHSCVMYYEWYNKKKNGFKCSSEPVRS